MIFHFCGGNICEKCLFLLCDGNEGYAPPALRQHIAAERVTGSLGTCICCYFFSLQSREVRHAFSEETFMAERQRTAKDSSSVSPWVRPFFLSSHTKTQARVMWRG